VTEPATVPRATIAYPDDPVAHAASLEPLVVQQRTRIDAERRLPTEVVEAMWANGIWRAAVPTDLDGPAWDPVTQVRVVEELSRIDGSVGWCAMIASAASYVSGFLGPEAARRWFGPPDACLAGQLAPTGRAKRVPGGYRVSGRFRFASGSGHATMMIAGCLVEVDGEVARHDNGRPEMRSAIFEPSRCTIIDTWHTTGLWGTGSNDYVVDDLFVAEEDSWDPAGKMLRSEPLYRYPPLFLVPHCGVPLGIARAAIDTLIDLAGTKEQIPGSLRSSGSPTLRDDGRVQEAVAVAEAKLGAAQALVYRTVEDLWDLLQRGERVPARLRGMYRITMSWCHQTGKEVVELMYDTASGSAIYRDNPLDRQMRDILTACQHRMVHPRLYRPGGRLLLGLDSGDPMV
jgi:alkylation response protein AidB-like acyl-CoA dehydrogenase